MRQTCLSIILLVVVVVVVLLGSIESSENGVADSNHQRRLLLLLLGSDETKAIVHVTFHRRDDLRTTDERRGKTNSASFSTRFSSTLPMPLMVSSSVS